MMQHLDLCSGIGGFALAAKWAGFQTVGFCEIDAWCQKVLAKNWPGVPIHGDIKSLDPAIIAGWSSGVGILTAGYPCQPFSLAGQRKGQDDPRHIWPYILRIITSIRPRWCVFENVAGHITMGLQQVWDELEAEGYQVWAAVIPAAALGAQHRRDRLWIIASSDDLAHSHSSGWKEQRQPIPIQEEYSSTQCGSEGLARGALGSESSMGIKAHGISRWMAGYPSLIPWWQNCVCDDYWCIAHGKHAGECECPDIEDEIHFTSAWWGGDPMQAFAPHWEQGMPRLAGPVKDRSHKLKALGNAIVPQIAYQLMMAIREAEERSE
jgi:DNA (cytosine-5)-methyltransferase 1